MRARWRWLRDDPNLGKALVILGLVVFGFAAWAVVHDNGPDIDGNFVDETTLEPCLRDAESPVNGWRLSAGDGDDPGSAPQWHMSWASERGLRDSATLFVIPTAVGAHKLDLAYGSSSPANSRELESFANVVYEHSDGREGPMVPDAVRTLIYGCLESAATEAPHGAEGGFSDCEAGEGIENPVSRGVRGESCEEARARLARGHDCSAYGEGFVCVSVDSCCGNSFSYVGDGEIEIVSHNAI